MTIAAMQRLDHLARRVRVFHGRQASPKNRQCIAERLAEAIACGLLLAEMAALAGEQWQRVSRADQLLNL